MTKITLEIKMKNKIKIWFYEFIYGHPFLLNEEVDIICDVRLNITSHYFSDKQLQKIVKIKVKEMYKKKFPNAKFCKIF